MQYESWFRGALGAALVVSIIVGAPGTARSQVSAVDGQPSLQPVAHREDVGRPAEIPEALEAVYATAVASGFEDRKVVETALAALADRVSGHQLQRIYADAVLSNAVPLSIVRQCLRELGHRREVWDDWPRDKVNIIYALSIVSGGEPDPVIRERLRAALDSLSGHELGESPPDESATGPTADEKEHQELAVVRQPFCDASCGPDDPEHPFNIYETDMYREWVLWYEWFHGGPCPNCWTPWELLIDAERIEAIIAEACEISDELSLVANLQTLYEIIVTKPDSAVGRYWIRRLTSWATKAGQRFVLSNVSGVGAAANVLSIVCRIREMVDEAN